MYESAHVLDPLPEADISHEGRIILWNNYLEVSINYIKLMVYCETLLNYPHWIILFAVYTNDSDKQLGSVIFQNNNQFPFSQVY